MLFRCKPNTTLRGNTQHEAHGWLHRAYEGNPVQNLWHEATKNGGNFRDQVCKPDTDLSTQSQGCFAAKGASTKY